MIATYQERVIVATKQEDGLYHVTIDGQASGITSHYRVTAIKRAMAAIDEQEQSNKVAVLKDVGL
jgi:LPS sulfotransferase NodH